MKPLGEIYSNQYFKGRWKHLGWRVPIVCGTLHDVFSPKTVMDVGCANGDLVAGFLALALDAWGLEGAPAAFPHLVCPKERVLVHDLRLSLPFEMRTPRDLVTCFEVLEHIEPEFDLILTENLNRLTGRYLVVSAAPPGQGGTHHVNCQYPEYWIDRMVGHGLRYLPTLGDVIRGRWAPVRHKPGVKAYYNNLLVFRRGL